MFLAFNQWSLIGEHPEVHKAFREWIEALDSLTAPAAEAQDPVAMIGNRATPDIIERAAKAAEAQGMPQSIISTALDAVDGALQDAYSNAYPVCCGRGNSGGCCGDPAPEWSQEDQRIMDILAPVHDALSDLLAAAPPAQAEQEPWQDDAALVARAMKAIRKDDYRPFWSSVKDIFQHGSTYSAALCRRFGRDPETGDAIEDYRPAEGGEE
ncbi:MAG TPA: hypothetical protein VK973_10550 [Arenicellales bacterium]|nr:hypothetical protein [Arenicellales bacterium]